MRKALIVVLTTFALVLGFAAIAEAKAKPAYVVSLKASTTSSVAGKFITLAGKVTGPNAAGKKVTLQRRYVGGPWVSVAADTVAHNGGFSARVETPQGGNTSFRAVKGASSVRKAGVSPTRTTKVFQWLYLSNQPGLLTDATPLVVSFGGSTYQHGFWMSDGAEIDYKTSNLCTLMATRVGYLKQAADPTDDLDFIVYKTPVSGGKTDDHTAVSTGSSKTVTTSLVGNRFFGLRTSDIPSNDYNSYLGDPKVYCNASSLPSFSVNEL